jgi:general secretion pathway protein G
MSTNTSLSRRRRRNGRHTQKGMTLLEIMIVLAIIALVMGFLVGPAVFKAFSSSKVDIAKATSKKYAYEAYTQWSMRSGKACPESLGELNEYMNNTDTKDPWGNEYLMFCGDTLPAGAKGLAVQSIGEDGKRDTEDDVKSWD